MDSISGIGPNTTVYRSDLDVLLEIYDRVKQLVDEADTERVAILKGKPVLNEDGIPKLWRAGYISIEKLRAALKEEP